MRFCSICILIILLATLILATSSEAREPEKPRSTVPEAQAKIDRAWKAVDEEITIETVDQAIGLLEEALKLDPNNPDLLVELADEYFQRLDLMTEKNEATKQTREEYAEKGGAYALRSLELKESAAAHCWVAIMLANSKKNSNFMAQAAIFPQMNHHLKWIEENDPDYFYGVSARIRARLAEATPGIVLKVIGGTLEDIEAKINHAISLEPRFLDNYVDKAIFLNCIGRTGEARKLLRKVITADPTSLPEQKAHNRSSQRRARKLWKAWTGKEFAAGCRL